MCGLDVWSADLHLFIKNMVIHDIECPYWDQMSLNNTNQTKPNQVTVTTNSNKKLHTVTCFIFARLLFSFNSDSACYKCCVLIKGKEKIQLTTSLDWLLWPIRFLEFLLHRYLKHQLFIWQLSEDEHITAKESLNFHAYREVLHHPGGCSLFDANISWQLSWKRIMLEVMQGDYHSRQRLCIGLVWFGLCCLMTPGLRKDISVSSMTILFISKCKSADRTSGRT